MEKALVLLSGGIDSTTLLFYVARRLGVKHVVAVSFLYGQRHDKELDAAAWQARAAGAAEHVKVDLSVLGGYFSEGSALLRGGAPVPDLVDVAPEQRDQPPTYVPNRNMILLAVSCGLAETRGIRDVFYGAQRQDEYGYWDCSPAFVERMNRVLELNRRGFVRVTAPFAGMRKADIVRLGMEMGVDYSRTWSCYRGGDSPCGSCPSCCERENAFAEALGKKK